MDNSNLTQDYNIKLVEAYGDHLQLLYGKEFGFYSNQITDEKIEEFCKEFNTNPLATNRHYRITIENSAKGNSTQVYLKNFVKGLIAIVRFFDHSVFIETTEIGWRKIDQEFFDILQKEWRKFLSKHFEDYKEELNKKVVLSQLDNAYAV